MNGFQQHGIDHLSASSLNLWTNAPEVWVAQYLLGKRIPFGPAPKRGQAVEAAVAEVLCGASVDEAVARAEAGFDKQFLIGDEKTTKERALIAPMARIAVDELAHLGEPQFTAEGAQEKISITANMGNWSIDLWGFLDFVYPEHGLVVDLKTTTRIPSQMSADHQLQRAIYAKAKGNHAVKFLYVSAKSTRWLEDGDMAKNLARAKVKIARLECFLKDRSAEYLRKIVPVNPSSFYWRGAERMREEIYGF